MTESLLQSSILSSDEKQPTPDSQNGFILLM